MHVCSVSVWVECGRWSVRCDVSPGVSGSTTLKGMQLLNTKEKILGNTMAEADARTRSYTVPI